MREIRTSGSEGGGELIALFLPLFALGFSFLPVHPGSERGRMGRCGLLPTKNTGIATSDGACAERM
jgi:hypothetical protein